MGCGKTVRIKEYKYIKVRRNYGHGKAEGEDRSEKEGWKKQRRKRKLILFIVEVLVILILLVVFYVMSKLNKINNTGSLDAKKLNINIDSETQEVLDNYTNIAIFGIDNRSSGNYESGKQRLYHDCQYQ